MKSGPISQREKLIRIDGVSFSFCVFCYVIGSSLGGDKLPFHFYLFQAHNGSTLMIGIVHYVDLVQYSPLKKIIKNLLSISTMQKLVLIRCRSIINRIALILEKIVLDTLDPNHTRHTLPKSFSHTSPHTRRSYF